MARAGIACSANFLVAQHGNGAVDIEAVPGELDVLLPERDVVAHTNHLLSPRLVGVRDLGSSVFPDTYVRLARVRRLLEERHERLDPEAARSILRDHANAPDSICRHVDEIRRPGRQAPPLGVLARDGSRGGARRGQGGPPFDGYVDLVEAARSQRRMHEGTRWVPRS